MEVGEGMVAVVHGLKDAGLAVTLLDSGRQYTLLPDSVTHPVAPEQNIAYPTPPHCSFGHTSSRTESGVQVTDGRYASTYKMMHCHMKPTSPPDLVTEFPPQKAELCPGHGNFEIGGMGSGEISSYPSRTAGSSGFRGGSSNLPERGSISCCKSVQPDSFASSLRRYPCLSPDRSSEIVERLISYTQNKNVSKTLRSNISPTRFVESDTSYLTGRYDRSSSQDSSPMKVPNRGFEDLPTREKSRKRNFEQVNLESWRKSYYNKTNELRCLRDVITRKYREGIPYKAVNNPEKLVADQTTVGLTTTSSVDMEIQAAVQMISREVVTSPIPAPSQRSIAVPLTPSSSIADPNPERTSFHPTEAADVGPENSPGLNIQTKPANIKVQAAASAIDLKQRHKKYKRSKSEEEVRNIQSEILDLIQDLSLKPCYSKFHRKSHNRINRSNKFYVKFARNCESICEHEDNFCEHKLGFKTNIKDVKKYRSNAQIFHAEINSYKKLDDEDLTEILEDWLDFIPLREEYFNDNAQMQCIFYDLQDCLKYFLNNPLESRNNKLKSDIVTLLDTLPLEINGNKRIVLNKLADILMNKIAHISQNIWNKDIRSSKQDPNMFTDFYSLTLKGYIPPSENELKILISEDLGLYLEKCCLKIHRRKVKEIKDELFEILMMAIDDLRFFDEKHLRRRTVRLLRENEFSEYQAICFANILIRHLKESFIDDSCEMKVRSETFIVLPSTLNHNSSLETHGSVSGKENSKNENSIDLESYINELCRQIDEWLMGLNFNNLYTNDKGFKAVVINELACDIVDRQKYLELNNLCNISAEVELEYLKYQIFKWISKLVGDDSLRATEHAPDLMKRIKELSASGHSRFQNITTNNGNFHSHRNTQNNNNLSNIKHNSNITLNTKIKTQVRNNNMLNVANNHNEGTYSKKHDSLDINTNGAAIHVSSNQLDAIAGSSKVSKDPCNCRSLDKLESDYEQFVKTWVQKIPIRATNSDEEALAEKARLGIYNGLWKAVSKFNCDPATYYNRFFYEDLLEDAIDDLLDSLPQTSELQSRKNSLKVEFIEKTNNFNDHIKASKEFSFKNKLKNNILTNLRKQGIIYSMTDDPIKIQEDLQIMEIVDLYILFTKFKNEDIFKNKFLQEVQNFVANLKKNHIEDLNDIDELSLKNDLINSLQKVPIPNALTIDKEADEILLGLQVKQWYTDLPIIQDDNYAARYRSKKQLDILIHKIKELEENISDESSESVLRNEVFSFLENNTHFIDEGSSGLNFMVDELIHKLKKRKEQEKNQNIKKVVLRPPVNYEDFSQNVPCSSSYVEIPQNNHNPNIPVSTNVDNNINFTKIAQNHEIYNQPRLNSSLHAGECNKGNDFRILDKKQTSSYTQAPTNSDYMDKSNNDLSNNNMSNQWYTLPDEQFQGNTLQQNMRTPTSSNPITGFNQHQASINSEISQNIPFRFENQIKNQRDQNSTILKNIPEEYKNRALNTSIAELSLDQSDPREIRMSDEMLGIIDVAGPSRYENETKFNNASKTHNYKQKISVQSIPPENIVIKDQNLKSESFPQFNKCSVGCQSLGNKDPNNIPENISNFMFGDVEQKNRDMNTSMKNNFTSTPEQRISSSTPMGPSRKRPRWSLLEDDEKQQGYNVSDNMDNQVSCRCLERLWKSRQRPKHFQYGELYQFPPCVPMWIPYPCFF